MAALTQAQWQAALNFSKANQLDPATAVAALELACLSPFIDSASGLQMVALSAGADGVTLTLGYEQALKLLDYFQKKASGGIFVQKAEFPSLQRVPGQSP